jgi:ectoine hydroxylase-related dioxygenase (phytanoyl-CoA dioxygenase family)
VTFTTPLYDGAPPGAATNDELRRVGYVVLRGVLDTEQLERCRLAIDEQLEAQERSFDSEDLASIGELDTVRAPLVEDEFFLFDIALAPRVHDLARQAVGNYCLLHLQNVIVNKPHRPHHQSAWHRDLPYLDRVSSTPLAVSALFCIDDFSLDTGATWCLPGSHLVAEPPSDAFLAEHGTVIEAEAGDVIVFDSMLVHRAGTNHAALPRRAVNNVYSVGIIRQQIDLPRAMAGRYADDPQLAILLGYASNAPVSADAYRQRRFLQLARGERVRLRPAGESSTPPVCSSTGEVV